MRKIALLILGVMLIAAPTIDAKAGVFFAGGCKPSDPFSVQLILRQDFSDVPILGCGDEQQIPWALGARASYSYDDVHHASGFSVDGLTAIDIRYTVPSLVDLVPRFSFGPFAQGQGSRSIATDTLPATTSASVTTGAYVQFYETGPLPMMFRLRGGELYDNTGVRDSTAVGELVPSFSLDKLGPLTAFLPKNIGYFTFSAEYPVGRFFLSDMDGLKNLKLVFTPELEAQYDSYEGGPRTYALFALNHQAMRVGPLLTLKLYGFEDFVRDGGLLRTALQRTFLSASYHADWDVLSRQKYYVFQPALIFNLNKEGTVAVTSSYSIGESESSGNKSRQAKVSLSAKF